MKNINNKIIRRTLKGKYALSNNKSLFNNRILLNSIRIIRIDNNLKDKDLLLAPHSSRILTKRGNFKMGNGKSKLWKISKEYSINKNIYYIPNSQILNNNIKSILEREIYNSYIKDKLIKIIKRYTFLRRF